MAAREYGQYCGVTRGLELVGERWALLIVRDLLVGPRRYGELAAGLPRIPTNILAARLKELQAAGVIRRVPHSRVIIYELTPYGRELEPVVLALGAWGFKAMGDLHGRGIRVPVDRDDLDAEALELDRDLLAQLAGTEQQHARGGRGQRGTDLDAVHGFIQPLPAPPVPWACRLVP